jgi:hypothetical protein
MGIEATQSFEGTGHGEMLELLVNGKPVIKRHLILNFGPAPDRPRNLGFVLYAFGVPVKRNFVGVIGKYAAQHLGKGDRLTALIVPCDHEFKAVPFDRICTSCGATER